MKKNTYEELGYKVAVIGVAIILLWVGIFKFSPTEASGIEPYVKNSFLMGWLYNIAGLQTVSNIIGFLEVTTSIGLLIHLFWKKAGVVAGFASSVTFLITLSFLFSTPKINTVIDGIAVTDFFVLKDIMALGISLMVFGKGISCCKKE